MSVLTKVSAAGGNTTIGTMPTHQAGDLFLMWACREGGTTITVPAGWTILASATKYTTCYGVLAYKYADSDAETSGTWNSASELNLAVYRGQTPYGVLVGNTGTSSGDSIHPYFAGFVPYKNAGDSYQVLGFGFHNGATLYLNATVPSGFQMVRAVDGSSYGSWIIEATSTTSAGTNFDGATQSSAASGSDAWVTCSLELWDSPIGIIRGTYFTNAYSTFSQSKVGDLIVVCAFGGLSDWNGSGASSYTTFIDQYQSTVRYKYVTSDTEGPGTLGQNGLVCGGWLFRGLDGRRPKLASSASTGKTDAYRNFNSFTCGDPSGDSLLLRFGTSDTYSNNSWTEAIPMFRAELKMDHGGYYPSSTWISRVGRSSFNAYSDGGYDNGTAWGTHQIEIYLEDPASGFLLGAFP